LACTPALVGHAKGASASRVTTHGEIVVAKFLAPKGPSGTYSNFWMSRALQSLHSTKPKMCSAARSIVSGVPSGGVSPPTKNP